jgi:hypothetical protein
VKPAEHASLDEAFAASERLQRNVLISIQTFKAGDRLGRDAIHDRRSLSVVQRADNERPRGRTP